MANEEKFSKTIDDEELDEVAGGSKKEFNEIRAALGMPKGSLDDVRKVLHDEYGITTQHWKAGGVFKSEGQAMYRDKFGDLQDAGKNGYLFHSEVLNVIKNHQTLDTRDKVNGTF